MDSRTFEGGISGGRLATELVDGRRRSPPVDLEPSQRDQFGRGLRPLLRALEMLRHGPGVRKRMYDPHFGAGLVEVCREERGFGLRYCSMRPTAPAKASSNSARLPSTMRFRLMKTIGSAIAETPSGTSDKSRAVMNRFWSAPDRADTDHSAVWLAEARRLDPGPSRACGGFVAQRRRPQPIDVQPSRQALEADVANASERAALQDLHVALRASRWSRPPSRREGQVAGEPEVLQRMLQGSLYPSRGR